MKGLLLVLCLLPALLSASPVNKESETSSIQDTLTSFLRVRRQSPATCNSNSDCLADPTLNPPVELVQCFPGTGPGGAGQCECSQCFMLNSNGLCDVSLCPDYLYNNVSDVCGQDSRPRQLTAFLVSLFASSTGAANFYIGQDGLGGGQLVLLLIVLFVPCFMCCLPCCMACCMEKDDVKGSFFFIIIMIVVVLLIIVASLAMSAWWIADLIIFATNQRLSSNGCTLTPWG
ncbi:uncharacterized protein LOC135345769 [Halichondria panicea]|uniref:uncharacterized protein LOC135345769 n=1 Tax=Halichondria panicea TaxID=6063 RepID=UPI00312BC61F